MKTVLAEIGLDVRFRTSKKCHGAKPAASLLKSSLSRGKRGEKGEGSMDLYGFSSATHFLFSLLVDLITQHRISHYILHISFYDIKPH